MVFQKVIILVVAMLAFGSTLPQYGDAPVNAYDDALGSINPASYSFSYDNNDPDSGNYYGHAEQREGHSSSGEYRVLLPDGRTQIVKYTVDGDGGYVAQVSYEQTITNLQQPQSDGGYQ